MQLLKVVQEGLGLSMTFIPAIILNGMIFSKPHFIEGDEDVCPKAQDEEDVGNGKGNYKVMACIPDEPRGCQVQYNPHKRHTINRNL